MVRDFDHYALLGVRSDASAREIRRAYRRLARQHHPDLNSGPDGPRRFAELADAYAVLSDPARRARYDRTRQRSTTVRRPTLPRRPAAPPTFRRGILELSSSEARHLARHPLALDDGHGGRIVLPAGTGHGDEIVLLHNGRPVILTIHRPQGLDSA